MTTPSTPTPSTPTGAAATPPPPPAGPPTGPSGGSGDPPSRGGDGPPPRRSIVALVAAAAVVVITVGLVLVFGLARPPALASLAEEPEPTLDAAVAWVRFDREACLEVATPDAATREVVCGLRGEEILGWDADGIAMLVWERSSAVEVIDPDSGEVVEVRPYDVDPWEGREREWNRVDTRQHDGVLTVRFDGTDLWEVEAPESYWINPGSVSPDGRFVVAFDSADRLLLFDATGERPPRVWLEDAEGWQVPVWEGTPVPVIEQD